MDQFDKVMQELLSPIAELGGRVKDSLYFLRQDGCFIFSHGYYHPNPGRFIGKIIHYPSPEGDDDIWGRRYAAIHKAWKNGEHVAIQNDVQYQEHFKIDPSLDPRRPPPLVAKYTFEFPLSDCVGYFQPHRGLLWCMDRYPLVKAWAEQTAELTAFPLGKMGVTGSLSYGKIEAADMDFDVIFEGDLTENDQALNKIYALAEQPGRKVLEFGKLWSIRIYWSDFLLCPFFVYQNWEDAPLSEARVELVKEGIEGTAAVVDDFRNSYLPIMLGLEKVKIDGQVSEDLTLICYDGSLRGEFRAGDRIWFQGRLLNLRGRAGESRAVAVDINHSIKKIGA